MKKILLTVAAIALIVIAIPVLFTMCGDDPYYYIGNISYNPETNLITWTDNSDADSWLVSINGGKEEKVKSEQYSYNAGNQTFSLRIEGLHGKKGDDENPVASVTIYYLDTVKGLKIDNGKLTWNPVSGATGYEIYNNGYHLATVSECSYILPAGSFNVYVMPTSDALHYCYKSESLSGTVLAPPSSISYENGVFSWSEVTGADYYQVKIDGKTYTTQETSYPYEGTKKDINISVSAGSNAENSHLSAPLERTCYYLSPVTTFSFNEAGDLIWPEVLNATEYVITVNNMESQVVTVPCLSGIMADTPYNVSVQPICGFYYTDSPIVYSFEKLSPVTGLAMNYPNLTWDAHPRAARYNVRINGMSYETTENFLSVEAFSEDINVQVIALGSGQNSASYISTDASYTFLDPISSSSYSFDAEGNLIWPPVNNATSYVVSVNGTASEVVNEPKYANIQLDTPYTVTVVPQCESSFSPTPAEYSFEKLSPVQNIRFAEGKLTWDAHYRAASYEVIINGEHIETTDNYYTVGNVKYSVTVEVYAKGTGTNSRSFTSTKDTYTYLPEVSNIRIEEGVLVWKESENANGYQITFSNGTTTTVSTNAFTEITPAQQYAVKIMPINTEVPSFSYQSGEFIFTVLAAPTGFGYQQGVFTWLGNNDASGYVFRVIKPDGTHTDESLPRHQFQMAYEFTTPGKYTVAVKIVSDPANPNVYDSAFCAPIEVTQLAPVTKHTIINTVQSTDSIQISLDPVDNACGYVVYNGTTQVTASDSNIFNVDLLSLSNDNTETTFNLSVKATGKVTPSEIILDSKQEYIITVVRLATPTNVTVSGNMVQWSNVNNANKYLVFIDGVSYECTTTQYQLTNLSAGDHNITVQAVNPGSEQFMPSRHSTPVSVHKLHAPQNVVISTIDNRPILQWEFVNGATGYDIKVGNNSLQSVTTNAYDISAHTSNLGAGEGLQISVYAKGNGSTVIDSEPSATITVARFNAPTGLTISGDNLVWNAPEIDGVKPATYEIYINGSLHTTTTGTSYSTANLPEGTSLSIYVKAIGNQSTTLDSPNSGSISVNKLTKITEITKATGASEISWAHVTGATNYYVNINGAEYYTTEPKMAVNFTSAGAQTISIRAISSAATVISSDMNTFTIDVKKLNAPTYVQDADINNLAPNTYTVVQDGQYFNVFAKSGSELPVTYRFTISGISTENTTGNYNYQMTIPGWTYTFKVQFKVSAFGSDGIYYISSDESPDTNVIYKTN